MSVWATSEGPGTQAEKHFYSVHPPKFTLPDMSFLATSKQLLIIFEKCTKVLIDVTIYMQCIDVSVKSQYGGVKECVEWPSLTHLKLF